MKTIRILALAGLVSFIAMISCQRSTKELLKPDRVSAKPAPSGCNYTCSDYQVSLSTSFNSGNTIFIWTITNPCPGNGIGGTLQNLSHWTFVGNACQDPNLGIEQNWDDVLEAWYNNGSGWVQILPLPQIQPDPSNLACNNGINLFKFNQGTSGSTPTQYKLVLAGSWGTANTMAYFKSGANTGCCSKTVQGIGCRLDEFCSFSQGFFFASPHPWPSPGTVNVGGFTYTEAEGRAIWNCSNAGGIKDSKKGFTQVAALKLSGIYPTGNAQVDADVVTIETWLAIVGKLVACSNLPTGNSAVAAAAGRIGSWIEANHCGEETGGQ